ncbi:MAG: hypothetical protein WCH39_20990 [Schlesneria sp.]
MSAIQTINQTVRDILIATGTLIVLGLMGITKPVAPAAPVHVTLIGEAAVPDVQATVYTAPWCLPCKKYIGGTKLHNAGLLDLMPADGWVLKNSTDSDAATAHVIIDRTGDEKQFDKLKIESLPCTIIRKSGKEVTRFYGSVRSETLAKLYNEVGEGKR